MTYAIPPTSPKSARAAVFGAELTRAMKARRVGTRSVAQMAGAGRTAVMYWRIGRTLPRHETSIRLSDALSWPRLREIAEDARRLAERLQAAIEAMCRSCEPEGVCRQAECPLRSVSPFRLMA